MNEEEQVIQVGVGAFQDGFYEIAEKQFTHFLNHYPNHGKRTEIAYLLGKTFLAQSKWREAHGAFQKILQDSRPFDTADFTLFWMAQVEVHLGRPETAKKRLQTLIRQHPKFDWMDYAYYLLGCIDYETGKSSSAETFFKKVLDLSKRESLTQAASFGLGLIAFKSKEYERAVQHLKPLTEGSPLGSPPVGKESLFWLSEAQFHLHQYREASQNFQTFSNRFKTDPRQPLVEWRLAYGAYRMGDFKQAIDQFKRYQSSPREDPLWLYAHFLLGQIYLHLGEIASSTKALNSAIQYPQSHPLYYAAHLLLYWNHILTHDREEAFRIFQRFLKLPHAEEEKGMIQWLQAQTLFSEGKIQDALPYYFGILNTKHREQVLLQIAKGYFFENQNREALTNLDLFLLEFPKAERHEEGRFLKAECQSRIGEVPSSLETYNRLLSIPTSSPWHLMTLTQVGVQFLRSGESDKAETVFQNIYDRFPNHPLFYFACFHLGNLVSARTDFLKASHYYGQVLKSALPELLGPTYFRVGEIFLLQGREEKALNSFQEALPILNRSPLWSGVLHLELGSVYRSLGRIEESKKAYRTAYEQSKDVQVRKAAKELLGSLESR